MIMQLLETKTTQEYFQIATALAEDFGTTAIERDSQGGTPLAQRDRLRESELLKFIIPKEYGGIGDNWQNLGQIIREFAKVDSSIAHVFSYHHLGVIIPHILGNEEQKAWFYTETSKNNWFWCNALNPLDRRTVITQQGNNFYLNGQKSFCSGAKDSDILPITAVNPETEKLTVIAIPTRREGIVIHDDWHNMGQRQTDSGSVSFNNVLVKPEEILNNPENSNKAFSTIRACLTQWNLANIYLGIAEGAFEAAKEYTLTQTKPWLTSGVEKAIEDPYILQHYGNLWVDLQGANCLVNNATNILQKAWEQQWFLSEKQRGEAAVAIATAKVAATKIGLEVTSRIFELMGARATSKRYGFDRYWRNLRTFTLHDPIDYKIKDLGNWVLNDEYPNPNFYS